MSALTLSATADSETRRALQLDALSAILPMDRRDRLAAILTDDDVATLKHLAREGMGENSLRALASDFAYLEAWAQAATSTPLPWPAPEDLALKFVAHHLWDPARRENDAAHGMPADVTAALVEAGGLRVRGPHAPETVKRRLASWSTLHRWRGIAGPFASPALRSTIRLSVRASARPRRRKSKRAVTRDILDLLLASCQGERLPTPGIARSCWSPSLPGVAAAANSPPCASNNSSRRRLSPSIQKTRYRRVCPA
jgi:integrase